MNEEFQMTEAEEQEAARYQKELADSLAMAEEAMPPEDYESTLQPAAMELQNSMGNLADAEMQFGVQPEAWETYQPTHQEIQEKLKDTAEAYKTDKSLEEKETTALEAAQAMGMGANLLQQQYQKLLEQDKQMREEMKDMRKQLEEMREITKAYSPEEMAKAITVGMRFLQQVDSIRQDAKEKKEPAASRLYQDAKESVHEVYSNIKATPGRIREAVKMKAYSIVDQGIRHVAGWFDKGISFIEKKKEDFLNLSPIEKERDTKTQTEPQEKPNHEDTQRSAEKADESGRAEEKDAVLKEHLSAEKMQKPAKQTEETDCLISMKELLHGDSTKVIKAMVDFMAKDGAKEAEITGAFTKMKTTAVNLMMLPEYSNLRSGQEMSVQR